jgi:hypothetical protein
MIHRQGLEVFARLVKQFESYADEVVFVGGWVHAIYLADAALSDRPIRTDDIDISLPPQLLAADRPTLINLAISAGFDVETLDEATGLVTIYAGVIDLDLLTDAEEPRMPVVIEGQEGLVVQGYPHQYLLRRSSQTLLLGPELHPLLDPPVTIRVPTLGAYVLGKALSAGTRPYPSKQAKDLVYVFEILRQPGLGQKVFEELPTLESTYPDESMLAVRRLGHLIEDRHVMDEVATQLLESFRILGSQEEVVATVKGRLRSLHRSLHENLQRT